MDPIDIQTFMKDPDVQNIIEIIDAAGKPKPPAVVVVDKTGDKLTGASRKIEGLKPDKYYMVEKELDADGLPVDGYPKYATDYEGLYEPPVDPGVLYADLGFITRIKSGSINGLTNLHTYTVRAAELFVDGTVTYSDSAGGAVKSAAVSGGVITIPAPTGTFSLVGLNTSYNGYEVMGVAVTPASLPLSSAFAGQNNKTIGGTVTSFTLEGAGTTVDYVFVKPGDPSTFKVLKVIIEAGAAPPVPDTIINIAAIAGVIVPVAGDTPVTAITPNDQYTGTVTWSGAPAVFAAGTAYTATITLTPMAGYTLTGVATNFFSVAGATTTTFVPATSTVTAVFPATAITITPLAIAGVTVPVAGATPVATVTEAAGYTGTVSWTPAIAAGGKFDPVTPYTATITLTAKTGYTLYGVGVDSLTVANATANNAVNSGVVTAVFPATGTLPIDIAAIAGVTVPVYNGLPAAAITDTAQYTGTVTWAPAIAAGGKFAALTAYTATITLTPMAGYTLTGVATNFFSVAGATTTTYTAGSNTVTAVFPATGDDGTGSVPFNITFTITDEAAASVVGPGGAISIARGNFTNGSSVSLTLSGTWDSVIWRIDGISDTVTASHVTAGTLTITNAGDFWPALSGGSFKVYAVGVKGGKIYAPVNNFVTITVTD